MNWYVSWTTYGTDFTVNDIAMFVKLLTDAAIKNLAFSCRLLTYVVLAGCRLVS